MEDGECWLRKEQRRKTEQRERGKEKTKRKKKKKKENINLGAVLPLNAHLWRVSGLESAMSGSMEPTEREKVCGEQ